MLTGVLKHLPHMKKTLFALAASMLLCAQPSQAIEFIDNKIEMHGYGHQGFLLTDSNKYLHANNNGTFDYNALALLFSAKVTDSVTIWTQIFGNLNDFRLDWAFVDYKLNDNLQFHVGQIKTPIGIYNEIRDIKYLQMSTLEPLIYQEELKFTHESFRGASAIYNRDIAGGNLELNLYGGQQVNFEEDAELKFNHLIGGKITYKTPWEGLSLIGSAYTSKAEKEEAGEVVETGRNTLWMGSVNYQDDGIDLKAEYAQMKLLEKKMYGYYVQAGYTFFDKLTPFIRYDYLTTDKDEKSDPAFYQKDVSFGIGYKFNSYVSAKIEDHVIRGYALPVVTNETAAGEGEKSWNMFAASINFMF